MVSSNDVHFKETNKAMLELLSTIHFCEQEAQGFETRKKIILTPSAAPDSSDISKPAQSSS